MSSTGADFATEWMAWSGALGRAAAHRTLLRRYNLVLKKFVVTHFLTVAITFYSTASTFIQGILCGFSLLQLGRWSVGWLVTVSRSSLGGMNEFVVQFHGVIPSQLKSGAASVVYRSSDQMVCDAKTVCFDG